MINLNPAPLRGERDESGGKRVETSNLKDYVSINDNYARVLGKSWLPMGQSDKRKMEIEDIPIMTTSDGTIVCIPKLPEMGVISCVGLTGTGKTLSSGRIIDEIFYSWQDYVAVMNDSQEETYSWTEPCNNPDFIHELKKLNQKPIPLPVIYLFPNFLDFQPDDKVLHDKNSITISVPMREVMQNIQKYIPDLGNSEKYLLSKKEELLEAESEEQIFEIIKSINTGTKGMAESEHKITSSFRTLFDEGILNLNNPSVPAYLTIIDKKRKEEIYTGNPFTAIMKSECIPSFITSDLYNRKFKDAIFSYYINALFEESLKGEMKGKRVWLYFDELTKVVHSNPEYNSPETERALTNIASRGRNNGCSILYCTQRYNEIPKPIRSQTKFSILFRHKSKEETKIIADDFALSRSIQDEILSLKKFEVIVATTEHFVCYKENKRWTDVGPIKGKIIPALHRNRFLHKKRSDN